MDRPASADTPAEAKNPLLTGWFNFFFDGERWEWSPELARIHGYEPGAVSPTTDLVMKHKHPDDRPKMAAILDHVRRTREPISTRHRIIDATGAVRDVIVLGELLHDDPAGVIGIHGHYIDVTHTRPDGTGPDQTVNREITRRVEEITDARGPIEHVKGMLMLAYRIDAQQAFELLKWRSQETNTKLRALAVQLVEDFLALEYDEKLPPRSALDRLFMTAHLRVADAQGSDADGAVARRSSDRLG